MNRRIRNIWRKRADEAERLGVNVSMQPTQLRELLDLLEQAERDERHVSLSSRSA